MYIKRRRTLVFGLGSSPDPGLGVGVELGGGHLGGVVDLVGVCEGLPGQGLAPEDPPPALLQVQPASALGDEGVPDPGMVLRVRRQRTFSASKICRTWLRPTVILASQATGQGYPGSTAPGRVHHPRTAPRPRRGPGARAAPTGHG